MPWSRAPLACLPLALTVLPLTLLPAACGSSSDRRSTGVQIPNEGGSGQLPTDAGEPTEAASPTDGLDASAGMAAGAAGIGGASGGGAAGSTANGGAEDGPVTVVDPVPGWADGVPEGYPAELCDVRASYTPRSCRITVTCDLIFALADCTEASDDSYACLCVLNNSLEVRVPFEGREFAGDDLDPCVSATEACAAE